MATIYKRGNNWWISYCVGGKRRRESLETSDQRIAKQKLRKLEYKQTTGDLELPSTTPIGPFLQAFCEHLQTTRTHKSYRNELSYLRGIFGPACDELQLKSTVNHRFNSSKRPPQVKDRLAKRHLKLAVLEELTAGEIDGFITRRIRLDHIAPKTANRTREVLHVMFGYAIRQHGFRARDLRFPNPADGVPRRPEADPEIRFLAADQIDEQLQALAHHPLIQTMVACYIYAGLRREEAMWLTHDDVSLDDGMIRIRQKTIAGESWCPKTRRNRRVPISSALRSYLEAFEPAGTTPWFFPSPQLCRWNPDNFSQSLRKINEQHGLPWSCLDYRHTFGSHLAMKGESLYKISELMGNSPEICRRHYAALEPERMRDTVEFHRQPA
jgi:integrase